MLKVDNSIFMTSKVICDNIAKQSAIGIDLMSQNILGYLRNLVEEVAIKIVYDDVDVEPSYENSQKALKKLCEYDKSVRFITVFHKMLQISKSHYTVSGDGSERLLMKYHSYLLKIRKLLKEKYAMDILHNIENIQIDNNPDVKEYYEKVAAAIDSRCNNSKEVFSLDRYYIQNNKPFYVCGKTYYEVTFVLVNSKASKFDRISAFTNEDIFDNYAVKLQIEHASILMMGVNIDIAIICDWKVSIRPCEIKNFSKILGFKINLDTQQIEYKVLMDYLTNQQFSLTDVAQFSNEEYENHFLKTLNIANTRYFCDVLDKCRNIILNNKSGHNVILYLLYHMNNKVINSQYCCEECEKLSNLYLSSGCIPFDDMPLASSLIGHNPTLFDLVNCIDTLSRDDELLARAVKNNCEQNGMMFTEITDIDDIKKQAASYNSKLYWKHYGRRLEIDGKYIYIKEYLESFQSILSVIQSLTRTGVDNYSLLVKEWVENEQYLIDCCEKREILVSLFASSKVALIYGSAGTGKTTMINLVSTYLNSYKKIYLANTNPAVDNLRRKVTAYNTTFSTIQSYLYSGHHKRYDLLVIDECSTVSNVDMASILDHGNFKLLLLVGDVYQIEAIRFGNWFNLINSFVPDSAVFKLSRPYRSTDDRLLEVWDLVRKKNEMLLEYLTKYGYYSELNRTIFDKPNDDQIILSLNYNGPYGINNLNRILQCNNGNEAMIWGLNTYKVGDPVLFNESRVLSSSIHNNLKGVIKNIIKASEDTIQFDVEIDAQIEAQPQHYTILSTSGNKSLIRFSVQKSNGDDDDSTNTIIPFNIAYAVSIHKSQGLEYDSVKIVISDEIGERVTHNIFYTAITRARKNLKIYCSVKTGNDMLENFKHSDWNKDVQLTSHICNLKSHYKEHD